MIAVSQNEGMKKTILSCFVMLCAAMHASAAVIISGVLANPASTDSPYEYVQLMATESIDFSITPYTVVFANNGTASSNGWAAGGSLSYAFTITSGTVSVGDVFYVGGSGMLINGTGSTDISSLNWLRTINTGSTTGDGFGNASSSGVLGNGGNNADGVGVFAGGTVTNVSVPVDALFFGTGVGGAKPATGGYLMPQNDLYGGSDVFGSAGNDFYFGDPASGVYLSLTGTYNLDTQSWDVARTSTPVTLSATSAASEIAPHITLSSVPEPGRAALGLLGSVAALLRRRRVTRIVA